MFGKHYQKFKVIFTVARNVRYSYLNNIIRLLHPTIMEDTVGFHITKPGVSIPFPVRANKVLIFVEIEELRDCMFTK